MLEPGAGQHLPLGRLPDGHASATGWAGAPAMSSATASRTVSTKLYDPDATGPLTADDSHGRAAEPSTCGRGTEVRGPRERRLLGVRRLTGRSSGTGSSGTLTSRDAYLRRLALSRVDALVGLHVHRSSGNVLGTARGGPDWYDDRGRASVAGSTRPAGIPSSPRTSTGWATPTWAIGAIAAPAPIRAVPLITTRTSRPR
ncbi:MAG: hypothetical protein MZU79_06985 [Anaerotruncus sp.]|nr:hypothetical protein [Anaerotruncus sp.]